MSPSQCPADTHMPRSDLMSSCHRVAAPKVRRALVSLHPSEVNVNARTHHRVRQRMTTWRFSIQALMLWCTKCAIHDTAMDVSMCLTLKSWIVSVISLRLCKTVEASTCENERSGQQNEHTALTGTKWRRHSCSWPLTLLPCITVLEHSWRPGNKRVKETLSRLSTQINETTESVA